MAGSRGNPRREVLNLVTDAMVHWRLHVIELFFANRQFDGRDTLYNVFVVVRKYGVDRHRRGICLTITSGQGRRVLEHNAFFSIISCGFYCVNLIQL